MAKKPAAFLDRDGVIIREADYLRRQEDMDIYPNAVEAVRLLNSSGYHVIVITNQSAVARGYLSVQELEEIHEALRGLMALEGAIIDKIYYCPHHPDFGPPHLRISCSCRKPMAGMIRRAVEEFPLDMKRSFVMGDHWSDMELAFNVGLSGVMVRTGHGREEMSGRVPDFTRLMKGYHVANHALDGVRWVLRRGPVNFLDAPRCK